ncbi:MAG: tRNA nucleotidyltransferase [Mariprofundaceae bacterium]
MGILNANHIPDTTRHICRVIRKAGGNAWLVGGSVRDLLLGTKAKDSDLEIYGLSAEKLLSLARELGKTETVGKSFGIIKLWRNESEIDLALPRTEYKTGSGHRGFDVVPDPTLSPEKAVLRRDFTMNAMMYNPIEDKLLDLHHGEKDLKKGLLRHVSPAFSEDPLRVLRAMQFAGRFQLKLSPETAMLCHKLLPEASSLPVARILNEWKKWAASSWPSYGLDVLHMSGWLDLYPQLSAMVNCPQDPTWHPEGDVWTHTKLVVDHAATICKRECYDEDTGMALVFAALCHDIGKPEMTFCDEQGIIRSPGHAEAAKEPSQQFFNLIGLAKSQRQLIHPLIREHLVHLHGKPSSRAVRRLAHRLMPANITLWEALVEADASGRTPHPSSRPAFDWLQVGKEVQADKQRPLAIINGHMLITHGFKPGINMGKIIASAYQAQLDGKIKNKETALQWIAQLST